MKLNKSTVDAIERHLPLYLEWDYYRTVRLIAQTKQNENGSIRTRTLYAGNLPKILEACKLIFDAGGAINVDLLPWMDMPAYRISSWLEWTPDLNEVLAELRSLWRNRSLPSLQPIW